MSTSHCICLPHICSSLAAICVVGLGHSHIQPGQIPRQQLGRRLAKATASGRSSAMRLAPFALPLLLADALAGVAQLGDQTGLLIFGEGTGDLGASSSASGRRLRSSHRPRPSVAAPPG